MSKTADGMVNIVDPDQAASGLPRSGKNIRKMKFFKVREKSGNFVDGQGNLERI